MIDIATVEKIAKLSRIAISDDEKAELGAQLDKIVGHVEQLSQVNTDGVEPTSYLVPEHDVLRDDVVVESLPVDVTLNNGPSVKYNHFAIPKVIG